MWKWYWPRGNWLPRIQRRVFVGPPEREFFTVELPRLLRWRIKTAARLVRTAKWVLGDYVPDPFDEEGPYYIDATVAWDDGNEDG